MLSTSRRQAYTEIDNFIELLDEHDRDKIPQKLKEFFKKEKDDKYIKVINPNLPIKEQNLKKETLALIAMLNLQYWCDNEEERKRLKKVYAENEIKYKQKLKKTYNLNKQNDQNYEEGITDVAVVEYKKENIFKRIKDFFAKIIRKQ